MNKIAPYAKTVAAFVAALATSLLTIFGDGDVAKVLTVIIAVAGVVSVFQFPNTPQIVDPLDEDLGDPNADVAADKAE